MALQLTIIKFPPGTALAEDRKTFGSEGGLIGRGVDADWVLSDPERFLSSKHCQISNEGNRYFLTDLSTNGTFLNGSAEPLGRGSRTALNDGDCFDVGEYRFKVALQAEADPFGASPFADASPFGNPDPFASKDPFAVDDFAFGHQNSPSPESMFMSGDYKGAIQDIAPDSMKITDPLVALDKANNVASNPGPMNSKGSVTGKSPFNEKDPFGAADPFAVKDPFASKDPFADPFIHSGSQEDSPDPLSESIAWPDSKPGGSVLPEDWADDISLIGGRKNNPAPYALPDDDSLIKSKPRPKADPVRETAAPVKQNVQSASKVQQTGRKTAEPVSSARIDTPKPGRTQVDAPTGKRAPGIAASVGSLDRTLIDALGLSDANLSDDQIREIHHTVGLMMRETLDGLMQVLRSRTSIKNEFRINITTIQPVENNPIKFSVSVDEVLDIMFLRKTRAYKAPLDAVQESFHSIADHQLAVIAGIRSAFRSALSKFDPDRLEEEFKQSGKGGILPGVMKGRLWNAYLDHYQKMVNDMERSFQELFGDEFVQAYEDQMRKLASARKRDL